MCLSSSPAHCCLAAPASSTSRRPTPTSSRRCSGLPGIDHDEALAQLAGGPHRRASARRSRPLGGDPGRRAGRAVGADPVHHRRRDQRGQRCRRASPFQRFARRLAVYSNVKQPNHLETVIAEVDVDGEQHLVKFSRYHDNRSSGPSPASATSACTAATPTPSPSPSPTSSSSTTSRSTRSRNATSPTPATPTTAPRALQQTMLELLVEQLDAKRLTPAAGEVPGYRPPASTATPR